MRKSYNDWLEFDDWLPMMCLMRSRSRKRAKNNFSKLHSPNFSSAGQSTATSTGNSGGGTSAASDISENLMVNLI